MGWWDLDEEGLVWWDGMGKVVFGMDWLGRLMFVHMTFGYQFPGWDAR